MKKQRWTTLYLVTLLLVVTSPGMAQEEEPLFVGLPETVPLKTQTVLDKVLYDYNVFQLDVAEIDAHVRSTGSLDIHLGNRRFTLTLEVNDLRAPNYQSVLMIDGRAVRQDPGPVNTFKGKVTDDPESVVRFLITPETLSGFVKTGADWIFMDDLKSFARDERTGRVVVYRDVDIRPTEAGCAVGDARSFTFKGSRLEAGTLPERKTHFHSEIQLATECDGEYYSKFSNPNSQISGILNGVDGIYESQINTGITIVYQQCWTNSSTDPYSATNANDRLNQFRDYWNTYKSSVWRDAAHMWTGVDLDGTIIGIAWVAVMCNYPSYAYGLSQDYPGSALQKRLTAHEIGHNLSADHDNQTPVCPGVSCYGSGPIMCSSIQGSGTNTFSTCSRSEIGYHIDTHGYGCLWTCVPQGVDCVFDSECCSGTCYKEFPEAILGVCD